MLFDVYCSGPGHANGFTRFEDLRFEELKSSLIKCSMVFPQIIV